MTVVALILYIAAAVLFGVDHLVQDRSWGLLSLGLMAFVIGVICQALVHGAVVS